MAKRLPSSYAVRQLKPVDVLLLRNFRLDALATDPDSFSSTVSREEAYPMVVWEERAARTGVAFELTTSPESGSGVEPSLQERPVGMVGYHWAEQGETPLARLGGLWVHPTHRGKGLGTALVEWVVEQVFPPGKESSGCRLQLGVEERNKEVTSMYERLGFRRLDADGRSMEYAVGGRSAQQL
ncbi:hypothetical protein FRC04_001143 [Tulasnella sp. 424]|nr:hypothetical protein FRC04_001143 [Tulasnella sp. 424]